jgi:hypothetical protein
MIRTNIQKVHESLMRRLTVRTVTFQRQYADAPFGSITHRPRGRHRTEDVIAFNRRLKMLKALGYTYEEMQAMTGASSNTIARHLKGHVVACQGAASEHPTAVQRPASSIRRAPAERSRGRKDVAAAAALLTSST